MGTDLVGSVESKGGDAFSLAVGKGLKSVKIIYVAASVAAEAENVISIDGPLLALAEVAYFLKIEFHDTSSDNQLLFKISMIFSA